MTDRVRYAEVPADLLSREEAAGMTGLALLQGMIEGRHAAPPMAALMGFALTEAAEGTATFRGTPRFGHVNPMGTLHGGWYGALLDSAMGCAVMTTLPAGAGYTTLEYKVNLVRGIPLGAEVTCAAAVDHSGRSTAAARAEIRGAEGGRLHATGSTTCLILRP